jgi:hypothetical protein
MILKQTKTQNESSHLRGINGDDERCDAIESSRLSDGDAGGDVASSMGDAAREPAAPLLHAD